MPTTLSSIGDLVFNGLMATVALLERAEKALDGYHRRDSSSTLTAATSAATIAAYYDYFCDLVRNLFVSEASTKDARNNSSSAIDDDNRSTSSCTNDATTGSTDTPDTTTTTAAPSPRWQDFAIQSRHFAFTCKIEAGFHFRFGHLFATYEERTATRMVLSALHGYWEIISWDHALIPMTHNALRRCNLDEQAAFEYLLANKQLYEHLFSEEWCWKYGCVGCSLPRNKFEYYGDDLKAQGFVLFEY
ncbi:hypothetical protein FI667_g3905, partial [Globisporangium splendens]